jgi:predicted small metal-binding protein
MPITSEMKRAAEVLTIIVVLMRMTMRILMIVMKRLVDHMKRIHLTSL